MINHWTDIIAFAAIPAMSFAVITITVRTFVKDLRRMRGAP